MPHGKPAPRTARLSRLLDRVVQQGRRRTDDPPPARSAESGGDDRLADLEDRVLYLERLVEGLQDSVHREAVRQERMLEALKQRTEPAEIARALERHSRQHGL